MQIKQINTVTDRAAMYTAQNMPEELAKDLRVFDAPNTIEEPESPAVVELLPKTYNLYLIHWGTSDSTCDLKGQLLTLAAAEEELDRQLTAAGLDRETAVWDITEATYSY
jgi:hypothetical protein